MLRVGHIMMAVLLLGVSWMCVLIDWFTPFRHKSSFLCLLRAAVVVFVSLGLGGLGCKEGEVDECTCDANDQ